MRLNGARHQYRTATAFAISAEGVSNPDEHRDPFRPIVVQRHDEVPSVAVALIRIVSQNQVLAGEGATETKTTPSAYEAGRIRA